MVQFHVLESYLEEFLKWETAPHSYYTHMHESQIKNHYLGKNGGWSNNLKLYDVHLLFNIVEGYFLTVSDFTCNFFPHF